jgi:competence CoiA-like predicted nuclease
LLFDYLRQKPTPKSVSKCPCCSTQIKAKCGSVKIWHWAHESLAECDANWEPTTQWHLDWQSKVHEDLTEIIMEHHIADIRLRNGKVIEIQHSNIPVEVVQKREAFYDNMTWIFDGQDFFKRLTIKEKEFNGELSHGFKFRRPRHYILEAKKYPFYIDFGNDVFRVKGMKEYTNTSDFTGEEYKSYYFYGLLVPKDRELYEEIFGEDFVG